MGNAPMKKDGFKGEDVVVTGFSITKQLAFQFEDEEKYGGII